MNAAGQTTRIASVLRGRPGIATLMVVLAAVILVGRYLHHAEFGLYVDDYTRIPSAMVMEPRELYDTIAGFLLTFGGQGRPFHPSLVFLLSFIGGRIGDVTTLYQIGFLIFFLNTILLFLWFRHIAGRAFAFFGALAFVLFPADTTQIFLTHALGLQPALTLFLLASLAYFSHKRLLAYLLILGTLLTYETLFAVFLAVPLLQRRWDRKLLREEGVHLAVMVAMGVVVVMLRLSVGEERVLGLGPVELVTTPLLHMLQGSFVSMGTFFYRPYQVITSLSPEIFVSILVASGVFFWIISRLEPNTLFSLKPLKEILKRRQAWSQTDTDFKRMIELLASGMLMLALAYPLTFTIRAHAISGRDTRVHFAAAIGAAMLCAWTASVILTMAQRSRLRILLNGLLALAFAFLVAYGLVVQRDYVTSWKLQQSFWRDLVALVPDAEEGTVILIDPDALQDVRQIDANTWNLPRVLPQIFEFPEEWEVVPRVYRLIPGWENEILVEGGHLQINSITTISPTSTHQTTESSKVVFIRAEGSEIVRAEPLFSISGSEVELKPFGQAILSTTPPGFLFEYLLGSEGG